MTPTTAHALFVIGLVSAALACGDSSSVTCRDRETGAVRALVPPSPGSVVITEFLADPSAVSDADGEWVEIFAGGDVDLNGVQVRSASATALLRGDECLRVPARTYALLARKADPLLNGGLPGILAEMGSVSLGNASGTLSLSSQTGVLLDEISWTQQRPGVASQLDPALLRSAANDAPTSFCPAREPWSSSGDLGTPGSENSSCLETGMSRCVDPHTGMVRDIIRPSPGQLVISELMADPTKVADSVGEWVELFARAHVDLNGLRLSASGATGVRTITAATCLRVPQGSFALFARNKDPSINGGVAGAIDTFEFSLSQGAAAQDKPHSLALLEDGLELDRVTWLSAPAGASFQLSADNLDGTGHELPYRFCVAPEGTTYGLGDRGSPGMRNAVCP